MEFLLEMGLAEDCRTYRDVRNATCVHIAAAGGDVVCFDRMLELYGKAGLYVSDEQGWTPVRFLAFLSFFLSLFVFSPMPLTVPSLDS